MNRIIKSGIRVFVPIKDRILFDIQLRRATPIFVYTPAKVGSMSVYRSLLNQYPGVVVKGHEFFPNRRDYWWYRFGIQEPTWCWQVIRLYHWAILEKKDLNVISLTREPIGRNVSAFFNNFERDAGVAYEKADFSLEELKNIFLSCNTGGDYHGWALKWFDDHIKKKFDIDVYATPFPNCGYAIYSNRNIRCLVMKLEITDNEKINAIKEFLGLKEFRLINTNFGEEMEYAETYRDFKKKVKLPPDYIAKMCESKYFKHFYSQAEIDAVKKKWSEI